MSDGPARLTLRNPPIEGDFVKALQEEMNESRFVKPKLAVDGVAGRETMAELGEFLYRLGSDEGVDGPYGSLSVENAKIIYRWMRGADLPEAWARRRLYRMLPESEGGVGPFRKGWGITARSWEGLHPGEFPPPSEDVVRPVPLAVSGGSWAYPDPEGQRGPDGVKRHYGIDWFGVEGGGTQVVSPVAGTVERVTFSNSNSGQVFGGVVSVRAKDGLLFVFRHVDPKGHMRYGLPVAPGTPIANIARWTGGADHTHHELYSAATVGNPRPYVGPPVALNPYEYYKKNEAI